MEPSLFSCVIQGAQDHEVPSLDSSPPGDAVSLSCPRKNTPLHYAGTQTGTMAELGIPGSLAKQDGFDQPSPIKCSNPLFSCSQDSQIESWLESEVGNAAAIENILLEEKAGLITGFFFFF